MFGLKIHMKLGLMDKCQILTDRKLRSRLIMRRRRTLFAAWLLQEMIYEGKSNSILVSGESGAGNIEFAKGIEIDSSILKDDKSKFHLQMIAELLMWDAVALEDALLKQFLTNNTNFTVIGVIGPPGVGKSTRMNELYGFDGTSLAPRN
ncbi:Myosin-11 [Camellia lanceoleosa]|uniref:Myosin-11 n=1 Tax=Camellia lanceoleosa TaxID=1840588 RepID=A0ACC0HH75_9ERIC|nr:Myosin-11 [Camellia lanceoleosa]